LSDKTENDVSRGRVGLKIFTYRKGDKIQGGEIR